MVADHRRGTYGFRVTREGSLLDNPENIELLRRLWIGREFISDDLLGLGDPGDFDWSNPARYYMFSRSIDGWNRSPVAL